MDLANAPANTQAGLLVMNRDKPLAALESPAPILQRYEDGESIEAIAKDLGITPPAIYRYLARHAQEEWKEYQAANALHAYQQAEDELRSASDGVTLSRARELVKSQQWKLERVLRKIYGADSPQVNIQINLGEIGEQIKALEADLGVGKHTPSTVGTQPIDIP